MLRPIQELYNPADYPDLLVGLAAPDDAAVLKLDDERALVITTDFFTPIVDDPYAYGAIAATNSLSDVYAMGATPILALNLVALPPRLPAEMSAAIVRGMAETAKSAHVVIAGGHTIQDEEPKVGLVVVGLAHPEQLLRKSGAAVGDVLFLTKPLGSGVIATAAKRDLVQAEHLQGAIQWMRQLNRVASQAAMQAGARAATDITGFGLLGHGSEMANASNVTLQLYLDAIPLMDGVLDYARQWIFPGGSSNNKLAFEAGIAFDAEIEEMWQLLLFDAQTSGGLLIALPTDQAAAFESAMQAAHAPYWRIGTVLPRQAQTAIRVARTHP